MNTHSHMIPDNIWIGALIKVNMGSTRKFLVQGAQFAKPRPCVKTEYLRKFFGMILPEGGGPTYPGHDWLHAMDRDSYQLFRGMNIGRPETCENVDCRYTYQTTMAGCDDFLDEGIDHLWESRRADRVMLEAGSLGSNH